MNIAGFNPDWMDEPYWSSDNDDVLRCVHIRPETHDVKTFVFAGQAQDGGSRRFTYLPGQFGIFEFNIDGEQVSRCYTWSSSPTRPNLISITVKKVDGGQVSNWLHTQLKVGDIVTALGPTGEFTCFNSTSISDKLLLISGGSGITPLMSMARALHDFGSTADITFLHCARTPNDVVFAQELTMLAHNMPHFRVVVVCDSNPYNAAWTGFFGRMSLSLLTSAVPDFMERQIYNCGPEPFMRATRETLAFAQYDLAKYREESFSFESVSVSLNPQVSLGSVENTVVNPSNTHNFSVHLTKQDKHYSCSSEQTLLQAALGAGVPWPYSCANGVCGTCKTKKISGDVEMSHNGGIRPREVREGWILPCCSKPLTNVSLEQ